MASFRTALEMDAVRRVLDDLCAPPSSNLAERVRALGAFYRLMARPSGQMEVVRFAVRD